MPEVAADEAGAAAAYDARAQARRMLRTIRAGALATLSPDGPFASLVALATLPDGSPVMVLSQLAAHTRHLQADPRCSILLAEGGKGDPLAHPRLTLVGRAKRAEAPERAIWRARYLARHPKAELYADFGDFAFWRLAIESAHFNGGFARAARFEAKDLSTSLEGAEALVAAESGALDHMNADHREALRLYATVLAGAPDGAWRASGIDPDGVDLARGDRTARLDFPERVTDPGGLRRILVRWAEVARATSASPPAPV